MLSKTQPYAYRRSQTPKMVSSIVEWKPTDFSFPFQWMYVPDHEVYLRSDGFIFTEEDFEHFDTQEKQWRETLPDYNFRQALIVFPEAIKVARKNLKLEVKQWKERLKDIDDWREGCNEVLNKFHKPDEREHYKKHFDEGHAHDRQEVERQIKKLQFSLSHLDEIEGKKEVRQTQGVSEQDIARAKEIPITNFYTERLSKHNKLATGRCPFHNEKTGSFTIYLDQNTFWCYGCGAGGTVVDFVMRLEGITFLETVKKLMK